MIIYANIFGFSYICKISLSLTIGCVQQKKAHTRTQQNTPHKHINELSYLNSFEFEKINYIFWQDKKKKKKKRTKLYLWLWSFRMLNMHYSIKPTHTERKFIFCALAKLHIFGKKNLSTCVVILCALLSIQNNRIKFVVDALTFISVEY